MARTSFNTTTLTNAIDGSTRDFAVGATTNMTAGTSFLVIDGEIMPVQAIPVSGRVQVMRGWKSLAKRHEALATIYIALGHELDGKDADGQVQLADDPGSLPRYPLPLGSRKRDASGNEYVFCDFGTAVYGRQPVSISEAFVASALATTGRGRVGVVAEIQGGTSDQCGWVQIYGRCLVQLGMSGVSPSDAANGPTTLSTSAQTRFILGTSLSSPNGIGWTSQTSTEQYRIMGMTVASDASPGDVSAVTSAASHTGNQIAVFLNYPFIAHQRGDS